MEHDTERDRDRNGCEHDRAVRNAALERDQGEHKRGEASRAEPADECDRRKPHPLPGERDRDGNHSHERQAERGVQDHLPGDRRADE